MEQQALATPKKIAETRVGRLREKIINAPQEICVERARYLTQSMKQHWGKDPLTRISLATENILNNISMTIRDDELIVGCRTSKLKGAPLYPENKIRWIEINVESFDKREVQRALITEDEKKELITDIIPFWQGKTAEDRFEELMPEEVFNDIDKFIFTIMLEITYGIGHFTMNHPKVLSMGLSGIIHEAESKLVTLSAEDRKGAKGLFYQTVIRSLNAAVSFANRYADLAEQMAKKTSDPDRRQELKTIADICRRVPAHPVRTFHEAVQSFYFIHLIAQIESGGNSVSLGRIDRILYPYYKKDIENGTITPQQARELVSLLFLKTNEIWNILEEAYIPGGEGTEGKTTQNVVVGGIDEEGNDATTELSYLILDAYADIRTVQPNFGVRLSKKSPEFFFIRAIEYAKDGVLLHFFNDDAIIPSLIDGGLTETDARDYGIVGCLEPNAQGKTFGSTFAAQFNGIKCVELALSNGIDTIFGQENGIESGDPSDFKSFDDLWNAYDAQFSHFTSQMVKGMACLDQAIAENVPSPFASAMIEGPMEKGCDVTRGGAVYNSTGVQLMGFSNIADSLYTVKKVIFEDRTYAIEDLVEWLEEDWIDHEDKQQYFLNKIEKYGNDHQEVDEMAIRVINHFCDTLEQHRNYRGGAFWPGIFSVGFHISMGAFTGATPDGRAAGSTLGNGITPSNGLAINGPTAILNSITKLPLKRIYNGLNLNMRLPGKRIKSSNLMYLIQTYFKNGGFQVQFNMVDSDTLKDARQNPNQYRDLIVRISGYSGIFVNLSDMAQEEIIERMEYEIN
ncbi:MAG: formate C-acetyltransferase/glycerol dehydratase family glycyl radical enzyme [Desulfobacteraceae bacterium]|nr:formate C-acetyltransferase/glycerol dehydratase family glycyl radical enzyme [Desulfobacteraceae bacterium]MBC2757273.1 formate C-acetyltransferase/glycerol dehydratase family glycyl radical enzyme [Desulfobacteraceae bacterium]